MEVSPEDRTTDLIVGSIIFIITIPGFILTLFAAIVLYRHKTFRNGFGRISALRSVADSGVLLCFIICAAPLTIISDRSEVNVYNRKVGQVQLFFQATSFHAALILSLNRFCAVAMAGRYNQLFSVSSTRWLLLWIMTVSVVYNSVYFIPDCNSHYNTTSLIWEFDMSPCGQAIAQYVDFIGTMTLFGCILLIDLFTLCLLRAANKKLAALGTSDAKEKLRRRSQEFRFFLQAVIVSVLYSFAFFSFHVLSKIAETRWTKFLCVTFMWSLAHACSGVIVILCNKELKAIIKRPSQALSLMKSTRSTSDVRHIMTVTAMTTLPKHNTSPRY